MEMHSPMVDRKDSEGTPLPERLARLEGDSPEARMSRRYPQKIRVARLLDAEIVADDRKVLGLIRQVVRAPDGKIRLIVAYSRWLGLFPRLVAVPIERVGSLGQQVGSIDMEESEYIAAPTWVEGVDHPISPDEEIRIALAKR